MPNLIKHFLYIMKVDWCNRLFILLQQIFLDELENKLIKIIHYEVKNNIPEIR